jgi:hypothetical protein
MVRSKRFFALFAYLIAFSLFFASSAALPAAAQKKSKQKKSADKTASLTAYGKPVMWEPVNIRQRDLYWGPGGREMFPDLSRITFIKEETEGHNKKYRIKDGSGRVWVAKLGREAQPETAAVRLMWALGFKTEINYLVPRLTIPGKKTYSNVRLEARPENVERLENWKWKNNPFIGTPEFQALKIMMVFLNNWDIVDVQNKMLLVDRGGRKQLQYIISDLGATFGKLGNNNFPIIYRLGRSVNKPRHYLRSSFIKEVEGERVRLAYKGKNRWLFKDITVEDARWLSDLMTQLTDKQLDDAFRAANYAPADVALLKQGVKNRIAQLRDAAYEPNFAAKTGRE